MVDCCFNNVWWNINFFVYESDYSLMQVVKLLRCQYLVVKIVVVCVFDLVIKVLFEFVEIGDWVCFCCREDEWVYYWVIVKDLCVKWRQWNDMKVIVFGL